MEPSKIFGGNEECHSSESGWTMYIGSPMQGGDHDNDEEDGNSGAHTAHNGGHHADETDANHEADSDDSMASDASSGPSHQGAQFYGNMEGGHGTTSNFKHDDDEEEGDCCFDKKAKKSAEKQKVGMKKKEGKEEKEQMTFKAKGATTASRSGSKVRKSIWLGKRK